MVLDLEAFDILPADIDHEIDFRGEEFGGFVVGNGLHEPVIDEEGRTNEVFAIADDAARDQIDRRGHLLIQLTQLGVNAIEGRALVRRVLGIKDLMLFGKKDHLGGRRSGVDAQIGFARIARQNPIGHGHVIVALDERAVIELIFEKGLAQFEVAIQFGVMKPFQKGG